jgi:hypothetical protein
MTDIHSVQMEFTTREWKEMKKYKKSVKKTWKQIFLAGMGVTVKDEEPEEEVAP